MKCDNDGICIDGPDSWHCQCPSGFFGPLCEKQTRNCKDYPSEADCQVLKTVTEGACSHERSCLHGGTCKNTLASFCECPLEWAGEHCEVPVCPADACANRGKCRPVLKYPGTEIAPSRKHFRCECPARFRGERCLEKVSLFMP